MVSTEAERLYEIASIDNPEMEWWEFLIAQGWTEKQGAYQLLESLEASQNSDDSITH